jgi:hypothetical protein
MFGRSAALRAIAGKDTNRKATNSSRMAIRSKRRKTVLID